MSQRDSGYLRIEKDAYETPEWVTYALMPHIPPRIKAVWEPAAGTGRMMRPLRRFYHVYATDISTRTDFLVQKQIMFNAQAIITNPPYTYAREFIEHALELTQNVKGCVAMLLRTDYDHARTRIHLFDECPTFAKKLVLLDRIVWFERPGAAPSFNHAWYIWDWLHKGPPHLCYGGKAL